MDQQPEKRAKTGGRKAGTPNKATAFVRDFFGDLLMEAFDDSDGGKAARALLLLKIRAQELDPKTFALICAYAGGAPPKAIEHKHTGRITLEQIVAGVVDGAADEDEDV